LIPYNINRRIPVEEEYLSIMYGKLVLKEDDFD